MDRIKDRNQSLSFLKNHTSKQKILLCLRQLSNLLMQCTSQIVFNLLKIYPLTKAWDTHKFMTNLRNNNSMTMPIIKPKIIEIKIFKKILDHKSSQIIMVINLLLCNKEDNLINRRDQVGFLSHSQFNNWEIVMHWFKSLISINIFLRVQYWTKIALINLTQNKVAHNFYTKWKAIKQTQRFLSFKAYL